MVEKLKEKNKKQRKKIAELSEELGKEKRGGIRLLNLISQHEKDIDTLKQRLDHFQKANGEQFNEIVDKGNEVMELEAGIIGLVKKLK